MRNILFVVICLLTSTGLCLASFSKDDAGTSAAQFLKLGAGARPAGMGGAFIGISDDATAVYWNPAGIVRIDNNSISIMHAVWFEDISYDWVSCVYPSKIGSLGIGIQYLSYGEIKAMDDAGFETGDNLRPSDMALSISYAREISDISAGVNIKYISSKISKSADAFAVDLGGMYKLMENKLSIGLVFQNIGTKMKFINEEETLPMNIKLGGAYHMKDNWVVSLDLNAPNDNEVSFGLGTEYSYTLNDDMKTVGRFGYNTRTTVVGGLNGLTAGIGINYKGYSIDYAWVPYGDLGNTHRISVNLKF